ncbi:MAG: hypothetical protein WD469_09230 [Paenibacillaceae bacterium]
MNKILPIILLFGSLTIFSGVLGRAFTTPSTLEDTKPNQVISSFVKFRDADPSPTSLSAEFKNKVHLDSVNGITLTDDVNVVIDKLGQPVSKETDPFIAEMEVYVYPNMNIGFSDGIVSYVEVLVTAETIKIEGIPVPIGKEGLIKALGEPDFVAADGIVFQWNEAFIKLYTDMETHEVTAIHYFHHADI